MKFDVDYNRHVISINGVPFSFENIERHGYTIDEIKHWAGNPDQAVIGDIFHNLVRNNIVGISRG